MDTYFWFTGAGVAGNAGFNHINIVVYDLPSGQGMVFSGGGPGAIGGIGSVYPVSSRGTSPFGPPPPRVVPPEFLVALTRANGTFQISTGTYLDDLARIKSAVAQIRQVYAYAAFPGPNSNTYARVVAQTAFGYTPQFPQNAPGYNYSGVFNYGGEYFNPDGTPTEAGARFFQIPYTPPSLKLPPVPSLNPEWEAWYRATHPGESRVLQIGPWLMPGQSVPPPGGPYN
jgi:hypothetical protein